MVLSADAVDVLALVVTVSGCAGALSALLQARRMLATGSAQDFSLGFLGVYGAGYVMWLLYGLAIMSWPLIIVDALGIVTAAVTLAVAVSLRRARPALAVA